MNTQINVLPAHFFLNNHNYERYLQKIGYTQTTPEQSLAIAQPSQPKNLTTWDIQIKIMRNPQQKYSKYLKVYCRRQKQ